MSPLNPCPLCRGVAVKDDAGIRCASCFLEVRGHAGADAVTRWNALANFNAVREAESRLVAYRQALASEFPRNAEGDYDVGSVHANVRQLKQDYRLLQDPATPLVALLDALGNQSVAEPAVRLGSLLIGEDINIEMATKTGALRWAVRTHVRGICLSVAGEWVEEPSPSNRSDDWLRSHRFPNLNAAVSAAKAAPHPTS